MYAEKEVERIERPIFLKGTNSERADDIPLIIHWLKQMEIASIIDQELAPPHGNRNFILRQNSSFQTGRGLAAFSGLTLYLYPDGSREITSLNSLQRQILHLMKISESIYLVPQLVPD